MGKFSLGNIVGDFVESILKDVHKGQVNAAIRTAKKKKLPNPVLDQMKDIENNIVELEDFLREIGEDPHEEPKKKSIYKKPDFVEVPKKKSISKKTDYGFPKS